MTTGTATTDRCPTGCGRALRVGMLMCRDCWQEVPRHLQREVNRTWAAWRKDFSDPERMAEYEQARSAALAAIA